MNAEIEQILFDWVRDYHDCGDFPDEISITHDGYAEDENGDADESRVCYLVVIHADSGLETFRFSHINDYESDQLAECWVWLHENGEPDVMSSFNTELPVEAVYEVARILKTRYS